MLSMGRCSSGFNDTTSSKETTELTPAKPELGGGGQTPLTHSLTD